MKTASAALGNYLLTLNEIGPQCLIVDLYTITLLNGTVLKWHDMDVPITFAGTVFTPMKMNRPQYRTSVGLQVDEYTLKVQYAPTDLVNGMGIGKALQLGVFDLATVLVQRVFMPTMGDTTTYGGVIIWSGFVTGIKNVSRLQGDILIKSMIETLNIDMPRQLISPGCRHTLFDAGCALNPIAFQVNGTLQGGSNAVTLKTSLAGFAGASGPPAAPALSYTSPGSGVNLPPRTLYCVITYVNSIGETVASIESHLALTVNHILRVASPSGSTGQTGWNVYVGTTPGDEQRQNPATIAIGTRWDEPQTGITADGASPPTIATQGYFALGRLLFTSGPNAGIGRFIRQYLTDGTLIIVPGLVNAPQLGDNFNAWPGCDKTQSRCAGFNNLIHFGGFPFVPQPETGL